LRFFSGLTVDEEFGFLGYLAIN